jgi:hypothetical protein
MMKSRIDELLNLSKYFERLTFREKLKLMEEAADLLRKGRPMREVLEKSGRRIVK